MFSDRFGHYGSKFIKAYEALEKRNVKKCIFKTSGKTLWIVVGAEGDQVVYEELPYCSCYYFHYSVLGGKDNVCYHIISVRMAKSSSEYVEISFDDEEYRQFLTYLIKDFVNKMKGKRIKTLNRELDRASVAQPG